MDKSWRRKKIFISLQHESDKGLLRITINHHITYHHLPLPRRHLINLTHPGICTNTFHFHPPAAVKPHRITSDPQLIVTASIIIVTASIIVSFSPTRTGRLTSVVLLRQAAAEAGREEVDDGDGGPTRAGRRSVPSVAVQKA